MPDPSPHIRPTTEAAADPCGAEVRLAADRLWLTVCLPQVSLHEAHVVVAASSVRIVSSGFDVRYSLPVEVEVGRFVARQRNGVIDIQIERVKKSR